MRTARARAALAALATVLISLGVAVALAGPSSSTARPTVAAYVPPIHHVFVIDIENKGYASTWGPGSRAPYLARTLRGQGVLLDSYYGTAHNSQPNYVAQISGQGPNPQMQADCQTYSRFVRTRTLAPQQAVGSGCVFPSDVRTLPGQLDATGRTWKGYFDDMGTPCRHPAPGSQDTTQQAKRGDQYAARHNPFVYFRSVVARPRYCANHVVDLTALTHDLRTVASTPNLTYIVPNLCNDGHDAPCVDGRRGGLAAVDTFMRTWVPRILHSPAFAQDGMLVITADESDSPQSDSTACCGEGPGPNSPLAGIGGPGGGRIGALVISRWSKAGSWSTTPYNHYSLLASIEEIFRLPKIGYARTSGLDRFGRDVYNTNWH